MSYNILKCVFYKFINIELYGNTFLNLFNIQFYCLNKYVFNPSNLIDYTNNEFISNDVVHIYNSNIIKTHKIQNNTNHIIYIHSFINSLDCDEEIQQFNISNFYNCCLNIIKIHTIIIALTFLYNYKFINLSICIQNEIKKCNLKYTRILKSDVPICGQPYYFSLTEIVEK